MGGDKGVGSRGEGCGRFEEDAGLRVVLDLVVVVFFVESIALAFTDAFRVRGATIVASLVDGDESRSVYG